MAVGKAKFVGLSNVLRNLNNQIKRIEGRSGSGLYAAGEAIKAIALPLTPIEFGHLRGGCYVNPPVRSAKGWVVEIGYQAAYAAYVHERVELHHDPPTQAKFLEEAMKRGASKVLKIIQAMARV